MFPIWLLINIVLCEADWIKISQIPTSEFQMYTTESTVDISKNVEKDAPIRYEDLEHIIGPGFEDELEKFYQRHKDEMGKKRNEDKPKKSTPETRPQSYEEDPWSVYDNPLHISVLKDPISVTDIDDSASVDNPMLNDKNRYEDYDEDDHRLSSDPASEYYENVTAEFPAAIIPKVVQFEFVQVKPKETDSPFTFSGFMKFLRDIQSSFVSKTARSIKDKIRTLEQFRDDILIHIQDRIQSLWPTTPVVRSKRGVMDGHHSGGMEFPSSEGALMTISFLTFAVFLIKLVLQVINTIKSKHYSYNSYDKINGASSLAAVSIVKQNRNVRSLSMTPDDLNGMNSVLSAIDNAKM